MTQEFFQHFWEGPLRPFWGEIFGILTEIGKISSSIFMPRHDNGRGIKYYPCPSVPMYLRSYVRR